MKKNIKKWFNQNIWSTNMVRNAVGKTFNGVPFTKEDFKEITGEEY